MITQPLPKIKPSFKACFSTCSERNAILDVNIITSLCMQTIIKTL